jgi:hypothetical protein
MMCRAYFEAACELAGKSFHEAEAVVRDLALQKVRQWKMEAVGEATEKPVLLSVSLAGVPGDDRPVQPEGPELDPRGSGET